MIDPIAARARAPRGSRRGARSAAVQAVYQWLLAATDTDELVEQFARRGWLEGCDVAYFQTLVRGVLADPDGLEAGYVAYLDRSLAHLDPVERAILMLAVFELRECLEIPYRVVINEALELAKRFGAQDGHRYVNGILDKVAGALRGADS